MVPYKTVIVLQDLNTVLQRGADIHGSQVTSLAGLGLRARGSKEHLDGLPIHNPTSGATMTSDASSMTSEGRSDVHNTSPKTLSRPRLQSYQSNSVPATPRQHAREFTNNGRSPSPTAAMGHHSPRSVSSEVARNATSFKQINPNCRFQSTQTQRRRIPYTIGADPLEAAQEEPKKALSESQEQSLSVDMKRLYDDLLPSEASQDSRKRVVQKLRDILREQWPNSNIEVSVFGSSGNLLYTNKSDGEQFVLKHGFPG